MFILLLVLGRNIGFRINCDSSYSNNNSPIRRRSRQNCRSRDILTSLVRGLSFFASTKKPRSKITNGKGRSGMGSSREAQEPRGERKLKSKVGGEGARGQGGEGAHGDENSEERSERKKEREMFRFMNDRNLNCFSSSRCGKMRRRRGKRQERERRRRRRGRSFRSSL